MGLDIGSPTVRVKDIPAADRPRERLLASGTDAMSDAEVLAVLLGTGRCGESALDMARRLIFEHHGLAGVLRVAPHGLSTTPGVGLAKAARLAAALEAGRRALTEAADRGEPICGAADVVRRYAAVLRCLRHERFLALLMDARGRVMREVVVAEGAATECPIKPRQAFAPAVMEGAAGVIFLHNHPSGDPTPSAADISLTNLLVAAGDVVGIKVLDHVVVGDRGHTSLAEMGAVCPWPRARPQKRDSMTAGRC